MLKCEKNGPFFQGTPPINVVGRLCWSQKLLKVEKNSLTLVNCQGFGKRGGGRGRVRGVWGEGYGRLGWEVQG